MSSIADHAPHQAADEQGELPACLLRDNLTSPYFPNTSLATLAAVAALAAVFVLTSLSRLNDAQLWSHLNHGRWIAEHAALPAADPIAAQPSGAPLVHSAWIAQRLTYEVHRWFGYDGLVFGHALLVTLTAGLLMLAVIRRGAPPVWAWTAGAAMFVLALPMLGFVRPLHFGQLGAALCLFACAEMPQRRHPLIWLPLVALAWANLDGSVLIGIVFLAIHAGSATYDAWQAARSDGTKLIHDRRLHVAWAAPVLFMVAACLNPHGPLLLVRLLWGEPAAWGTTGSLQMLKPFTLSGMLLLGSIGLTAILAKFSPRKWDVQDVLLLLVFGLATLASPGMLAWWAVVWPLVCIPHAAAAWRSLDDTPTAMRTVIAMGIVFAAILISPPTYSIVAGHSRGEGQVLSSDTPLYVADEAIRRDLTGTIAAPIEWADFLAWKTGGKLRPLAHAQIHHADPAALAAYQTVFAGDDAWLDALRDRRMQYVLVSRSHSPQLARQVLADDRGGRGGVRIIYQDLRCILAEVLPAQNREQAGGYDQHQEGRESLAEIDSTKW